MKLKLLEKFALWITDKVSTVYFFLFILLWTGGWLTWNIFAPKGWRFDPYPAFVMWLFLSNMIQIFLMPLIMVGQEIHTKMMDEMSEQHFLVNKNNEEKAKEDLQLILKKLEEILNILEKKD